MTERLICIRDCYYGLRGLRQRFYFGDLLPPEMREYYKEKPCKWFAPVGHPIASASTANLISQLKKKHNIDLTGSPQQRVIETWHSMEEKAAKQEVEAEEPPPPGDEETTEGPEAPSSGWREARKHTKQMIK